MLPILCHIHVILFQLCLYNVFNLLLFSTGGIADSKMEVKTSLLDNMIGVGDMVLLEPLNEDSFIENLRKRFDHNEIYVSSPSSS